MSTIGTKKVKYYNDYFREDFEIDAYCCLCFGKRICQLMAQIHVDPMMIQNNQIMIVDMEANEEQGMGYWYHTFIDGNNNKCNCTKVFLFECNPTNFSGKTTFHTKK